MFPALPSQPNLTIMEGGQNLSLWLGRGLRPRVVTICGNSCAGSIWSRWNAPLPIDNFEVLADVGCNR